MKCDLVETLWNEVRPFGNPVETLWNRVEQSNVPCLFEVEVALDSTGSHSVPQDSEGFGGPRLHEQACISRSARGAVWGVLTCLFVLSRYKGPTIFFACGALRIPRPNFYLFGAKSIRESFSSAWFAVFL